MPAVWFGREGAAAGLRSAGTWTKTERKKRKKENPLDKIASFFILTLVCAVELGSFLDGRVAASRAPQNYNFPSTARPANPLNTNGAHGTERWKLPARVRV